jgi:hypothetical protein
MVVAAGPSNAFDFLITKLSCHEDCTRGQILVNAHIPTSITVILTGVPSCFAIEPRHYALLLVRTYYHCVL